MQYILTLIGPFDIVPHNTDINKLGKSDLDVNPHKVGVEVVKKLAVEETLLMVHRQMRMITSSKELYRSVLEPDLFNLSINNMNDRLKCTFTKSADTKQERLQTLWKTGSTSLG